MNFSTKKNNTIKYYLRETDTYLALLEVINSHIQVNWAKDINPSIKTELEEYFSSNIPNWEKLTFDQPIGGQLISDDKKPSGQWDGVETLNFTDNPDEALIYLYISVLKADKKDKFHMKYIITSSVGHGLDILQ
jgi:hypothetical protein